MSSGELKLNLNGLEAGFARLDGVLEIVVLDAAGVEERHRLQVACEIDVQGRRIHIGAEVRGQAESQCHRCLATFPRQLETRFDLILQRGGESPGDEIVLIPESQFEYDLAPHVREAVILEEPIRLICRPDCKGLCAQCGQDRNLEACSCVVPLDSRWEALKKLSKPLEP